MLTFAVVTGSLLGAYFLVGGAENSARVGMDRLGADLLVVPEAYQSRTDSILLAGHPSTFFFNGSELEGVVSVPGVERVAPQTYIATLNAGCCAFPTQLVAFNASQDFTITPWLRESLGRPLEKDEVILGSSYIGGAEGLNLMFYGHGFRVAGVLEPTGTGVDQSVFIQDSDAWEMAEGSARLSVEPLSLKPGEVSSLLVKLEPGADAEEVGARIVDEVRGAAVISSNHMARRINDQLAGTVGSLYLTAGAVTVVSVPLIATVSTMVANERRREVGLLRALGASKRFVFTTILSEAVFLAAIGAVIGTLATGLLITVFKDLITTGLEIPFLWPSMGELLLQVGSVAALATAFGGLAALYPAIRASRADPYEAIRAGQA